MNAETPLPPAGRKTSAKLLAVLLALIVVVALGVYVLLLLLVSEPLNLTADDIAPADVAELRVQLLNRPDGKDDVNKVVMRAEDYAALLAPLRNAEPLAEKPGMPWLGEYQIRFSDNRRITIRLRWERIASTDTRPALASAVGGSLASYGTWVPPADQSRVWLVIEGRIYRAGRLAELLRVADECAARAK